MNHKTSPQAFISDHMQDEEVAAVINSLNKAVEKPQRYIVQKLGDGVGSRVMRIANVLAISNILNATPIFIWRKNNPCGNLDNFSSVFENEIISISVNNDAYQKIKYNQDHIILLSEQNLELERICSLDWEGKNIIIINTAEKNRRSIMDFIINQNKEQKEKIDEKIEKFIHGLVFVQDIRERGDEFISKNFKGKILGVHVRGGDARKRNMINRIASVERYFNQIDKIQDDYDTIFLSTEDEDQSKPFIDVYGKKVVYFPKTFSKNRENIDEALIEMYLLSKCNLIIKTPSNFSKIAAMIGKVPTILISNKQKNSNRKRIKDVSLSKDLDPTMISRINHYLSPDFKTNKKIVVKNLEKKISYYDLVKFLDSEIVKKNEMYNNHFLKINKKAQFGETTVLDLIPLLKESGRTNDFFLCEFGDIGVPTDEYSFCKVRHVSDSKPTILKCIDFKRHWGLVYKKPYDIPFDEKIDKLIWRGGATSDPDDKINRFILLEKYFDKNADIDIGLSKISEGRKDNERFKKYEKYIKGKMLPSEMLKYKYILSIKGNDKDSGINWKLNSNSLVLMPKPTIISWLMEDKLIPGTHYVLLKDDLSDLEEKLEWCRLNQDKCKEIIKNANEFMEQFMDPKKEKIIEREVIFAYLDKMKFLGKDERNIVNTKNFLEKIKQVINGLSQKFFATFLKTKKGDFLPPRKKGRIYQIGFNKTGTSSLNKFFVNNGIRSIHYINNGETIASNIYKNFEKGLPLFRGYEKINAFTDMECLVDYTRVLYSDEKFKELAKKYKEPKVKRASEDLFKQMYYEDPEGIFILNIRPVEDWIKSRLNHEDYWKFYRKDETTSQEEVIEYWKKEFDEHVKAVKEFFKDKGNLLIFDISKDTGEKLSNYLKKFGYKCDPALWYNYTKKKKEFSNLTKNFL